MTADPWAQPFKPPPPRRCPNGALIAADGVCCGRPHATQSPRPAADEPAPHLVADEIDRVLRELANSGREFTAADVSPRVPDSGPGVIGSRFRAAAAAGWIVQTGTAKAKHDAGHSHLTRVWRGSRFTTERPDGPEPEPADELSRKAYRLLTSGAVTIVSAEPATGRMLAAVKGDSGTTHTVRRSPGGRWTCSCPASGIWRRDCSHLAAVRRVGPDAANPKE